MYRNYWLGIAKARAAQSEGKASDIIVDRDLKEIKIFKNKRNTKTKPIKQYKRRTK